MWVWVAIAAAFATPANALDVVRDGQAVAAIVTADEPAAEERAAATELAHYLDKATGAELSIVAEGEAPAGPQVHVGHTDAARSRGLPPEGLDRDGVVMQVAGHVLYLCGGDAYATQFAVTRFLQTRCGCRWYIPTELGEHIPHTDDLSVPDDLNVVEEPGYLSRLWSSPSRMDPDWPRRNMIRGRFDFHHNLLNVFTTEVYDEHPEFFPLIDGKRRRPAGPDDHGWQPCCANAEAARFAAGVAAKAFDVDPSRVSFSLGINDSNTYCQCDACKALDDPEHPEFRGRPNMSNRVFHFMNAVAEELAKTHPDRYLGCLAYSWCEDVPTIPVNDRIIPYLTNDRAQWRDPEFRRTDQELIRRWCAEQPIVGIYDYYYGSGYVIPRVFTRLSDESIKFAYRTGVRAFYAEIYSSWSLDGPKAWLASQLLWDPEQDAGKLLDDFYQGFFAESAEPMREYFGLCERRWMNQPGQSRWFKGFFDIRQMELFPPDICRRARALLDKAESQATSDLVRRRVRLYSEGFHHTELYSDIYFADKALSQSHVRSARDLRLMLPEAERLAAATAELERYDREVIQPNPLHASPIPFAERASFSPLTGLMAFLTEAMLWAQAHEEWDAVRGFAERFADAHGASPAGRLAQALIYLHDHPDAGTETIANGGMEEEASGAHAQEGIDWTSDSMPDGWAKWLRPGTPGELVWTTDEAAGGKASLRATGAVAACFLQKVSVTPGRQFLCRCRVKAKVSQGNRTELLVQWQDTGAAWVAAPKSGAELPVGKTDGWQPLQTFFVVPEGVGYAVVGLVTYDQAEGDYACFDDVSCLRLDLPTESIDGTP